jgi:putative membrane protein
MVPNADAARKRPDVQDGSDTHPRAPGVTAHVAGAPLTSGDISVELSKRRTGMSFQRTRMSADRTLMSVIRTSLSLISFGFTIYQFFSHLRATTLFTGRAEAPRNFGVTLVAVGIGMLVLGIGYHAHFMLEVRRRRTAMRAEGLIHGQSGFPPSLTLITAVLLLLIGVVAIVSMLQRSGPFG